MRRVAEAQFAILGGMRDRHSEQFTPGCAGDRDDRPGNLAGQESPGLALQFEPVAQATPFAPIGVLDEHGQDARAPAGQAVRCDLGQAFADRYSNLIRPPCPGRHDENAGTHGGKRQMSLWAELPAQQSQQARLIHRLPVRQRMQPQNSRPVLIPAAPGLQQSADPIVRIPKHIGLAESQALRQGHLQQVAPGVVRQPAAQVVRDLIGEVRPGCPMHQPPRLGGNDIAGDLGLKCTTSDQQVEGRIGFQAGKADLKPTPPLQRSSSEKMEQRQKRLIAGQRMCDATAQPHLAAGGEPPEQRHRIGGEPGGPDLRARGRPVQSATQTLDRQLKTVALANRQADTGP